jgi:hypothetical protein
MTSHSMAALSHRKPASVGTACDDCANQKGKINTVQYAPVYAQVSGEKGPFPGGKAAGAWS